VWLAVPVNISALSTRSGPITGDTVLSIYGSNFVFTGEIAVQFVNGSEKEIVVGTFVNDTVITCITPSFAAYASHMFVEVSVALNSQQFTSMSLPFQFYGML